VHVRFIDPMLLLRTEELPEGTGWLRPHLVGKFEFVEWTPDGHLRHSRFVGLREDKKASDVRRE
jgi:bifunctional non-homologous end joining protein LigD